MTWHDIISATKGGMSSEGSKSHSISIDRLCIKAQKRLREGLHIYEDNIFSLRLSGKERVFGILTLGVFRIIWYDPNHEICPIEKRN